MARNTTSRDTTATNKQQPRQMPQGYGGEREPSSHSPETPEKAESTDQEDDQTPSGRDKPERQKGNDDDEGDEEPYSYFVGAHRRMYKVGLYMAGDCIRVLKTLPADSTTAENLDQCLQGQIKVVDQDGDLGVIFEYGLQQGTRIARRNFDNIELMAGYITE